MHDSRSPTNTSARRAAVQRAILDATETLLAGASFHALTVEDVMKKAGLTRTAFYRYFPDLEAVLRRRMSELHAELATAANLWLDLAAEPTESILAANTGLAEIYHHHGRILLAFADAAGRGPEIEKAWHDTVCSFVAPVVARINELQARGLTSLPNVEETSRALVWMNERYLLETFGRRSGADVRLAAETLSEIWRRVLFA